MDQQLNRQWLKGSLPQWVVVILLASLGFFAQRTFSELDTVRSRQVFNENRITILERDSTALREMISDIKQNQRDMLLELRTIGAEMRRAVK